LPPIVDNFARERYYRVMTHPLDISRLTPAERILLAEDLWDSLATTQEPLPLTLPQTQELDRRLDAADRGRLVYSSWANVKERILRPE
jgi:putative addiction module component (TIGR02574 family)